MSFVAQSKEEQWEDVVNDFLFANYDFEYFHASRCEAFQDMYCNMIKFPKAENGRLVNKAILEQLLDNIEADQQLADDIFGAACDQPIVTEDNLAFYILWNIVPDEEFDSLDEESKNELFNY